MKTDVTETKRCRLFESVHSLSASDDDITHKATGHSQFSRTFGGVMLVAAAN